MTSILIINGPNLNLLGKREPHIYGNVSLAKIEDLCRKRAEILNHEVEFFQSNHEGEIIDVIQAAINTHAGIIINPAAFTHTSIAIADAISAVKLPTIEVHLSNIHQRETFRNHSYVSLVVDGVICGIGPISYTLAIEALDNLLHKENC